MRAPMWPRPLRVYGRQSFERSRNDFVRLVGPACRRSNPSSWINEGFYVDARRGVRIANVRKAPNEDNAFGVRPVFRRLYNDGTVGRLEIGFIYNSPQGRSATFGPGRDLVKAVMSVKAWLRGNPSTAQPLIYFGPTFARLLLSATTRSVPSEGAPRQSIPTWWVLAGDPAVIIEESGSWSEQVETYHIWQAIADIQVSVWMISKPEVGQSDQLRRVRIYLSHLHSDLATLEIVLSLCAAGRLDGRQAGLRDYLDRACGRLLREQRDGLFQEEYIAEVLGAMRTSYADKISALRELSMEIDSKGLSRKVEDVASLFEKYSMPFGRTEITMGDSFKTEIRAGNVAGVGVGQARIETGGISQGNLSTQEDLSALSEKVAALIARLRGHMPDDDVDAAEDAAEGLRREIEKAAPDKEKLGRRVDKLLSIAARAGAAGTALASAIAAIKTAFGL